MTKWAIVAALHLTVIAGCGGQSTGGGSETGFLECADDRQCPEGTSCVASVCTGSGGSASSASAGNGAGTAGFAGSGGSASAGGGPAACDVNFTDLASAPAVSFRTDVMPVFGLSCTASTQCHGTQAIRPKAALFLGPTCQYNTATSTCEFVTTPLTDDIVNMVLASLLTASATAPAVQRVAPGDPAGSFVIQKAADIHDDQGHTCTPQDTTATTPCGNEMPPGATLCLQNNGQARFDKIAKWILDGAQNN